MEISNFYPLTSREVTVLKYIGGDHEYETIEPNTFIKIPNGFTKAQFTAACDSLEEKGMIKTAYCEGHILQEARVLNPGNAYLDDLAAELEKNKEESAMKKSLFGSLSVGKGNRNATYWHNGVYGQIIDLESKGEFHLIDYIDEYTENPLYLSNASEKENSPIVAKGLVGYLLNQQITGRIMSIEETYRDYAEMCFKKFERKALLNPNSMKRNHRFLFFKYNHDEAEKKKIKESEAIYPYLTEDDVNWIEERVNGYWVYIEDYKKTHCAPKTFTLDSFLSLFGKEGLASKCLLWMEETYDIHQHTNYQFLSRITKTVVNPEQLSKEIIVGSDEIDFDAFRTGKEALLEEIESLLKSDDVIEIQRKMAKIMNALNSFSSKLYPFNECRIYVQQIQKFLLKSKTDNSVLRQSEDPIVKDFKLLLNYSEKIDEYKEKSVLDCQIESYTKKYIDLYTRFVRNLDYLLMQYGKDLLDLQKEYDIHLMKPNDKSDIAHCCLWDTYKTISFYFDKLPNRWKNMDAEEKIMDFLDYPYLEEEVSVAKEETKVSASENQDKVSLPCSSTNDIILKCIKDYIIAKDETTKNEINCKLCEFIKGNLKPIKVLRPLRAAIEAGCIEKPVKEEFEHEFSVRISTASWKRYTGGTVNPYDRDKTYEGYLRQFQALNSYSAPK